MSTKNLILIGFMGVGKGTIARALAIRSDLYVLDTDDLIESMYNMSIKKIFKDFGEDYFRSLEHKTADWLENNVKATLISTGGGFFKVPNLKKIGNVLYLESSFDSIYERIIKHPKADRKLKKRPLFQNIDSAKKLYETRKLQYESVADITVSVENKELDDVVDEILPYLKNL